MSRPVLLLRSVALGMASGGRSSLGFAGLVLSTPATPDRSALAAGLSGRTGTSLGVLALAAELVADKLPGTPSRLDLPALALRLVSGSGGAAALARREHARPVLPAAAGALGAVVGSWAGAAWREAAAGRMPDWQAALVEDGAALLLAVAACRRRTSTLGGRGGGTR